MTRRACPPPSHLRLVFSAEAPDENAATEALPSGWGAAAINDLMIKMLAAANQIADRAIDAMRREVAAFGFDIDAQALAAIRDPVLRTIAARIRARIVGAANDTGFDVDDLAGDPDDDLHPCVEHTGEGLRERLRLALETSDEPA